MTRSITIPELDGIYPGVDEESYHADTTSLSSTGARLVLQSPAKYKWRQEHTLRKPYFDLGSAVHTIVLGVGAEIRPIDADSYRTKSAQEARDKAYAEGVTPLLAGDFALAHAMADAVREHPAASALLKSGEAEQSVYWTDAATGIRLRARIDWLTTSPHGTTPVLVDLKTTGKSAHPKDFAKTAAQYGYHFQAAWYLTALRETHVADNADFVFVTVEKEAPHLVSVTRLSEDALALGEIQMRQAINTYAACIETGEWPGYGDVVHDIDLPAWAYYTGDKEPEIEIA